MAKVLCRNCLHYKQAPYEARKTGCYHVDNMPQKHKEAYLDEQQIPGDHRKINLRGDCAQFEARPALVSWWKKWLAHLGRSSSPGSPGVAGGH